MTDARLAEAYGQAKAIEVEARSVGGSEYEQALAIVRQAVALRKEIEQLIVMRAVMAAQRT